MGSGKFGKGMGTRAFFLLFMPKIFFFHILKNISVTNQKTKRKKYFAPTELPQLLPPNGQEIKLF